MCALVQHTKEMGIVYDESMLQTSEGGNAAIDFSKTLHLLIASPLFQEMVCKAILWSQQAQSSTCHSPAAAKEPPLLTPTTNRELRKRSSGRGVSPVATKEQPKKKKRKTTRRKAVDDGARDPPDGGWTNDAFTITFGEAGMYFESCMCVFSYFH